MADNVSVPSGSGAINVIIGADEVTDGTLGTVKIQYMKLMDGTLDGTVKSTIKAASTAPVATDPALVVALSPNAPAKISDGTNTAAVKAASTAPVAADPALVVSMSPNSTTFVQGVQGTRNTGNITTATSVVGPFTASGFNIATVTVSGTYTGVTFVFEGTDDGTNWFALQGCRTDISIVETGATLLTTTARAWDVPVGAMTQIRVRATAWTSGTAVIGITFQSMPYEPAPAVGLSSVGGTTISIKSLPTNASGLAAIPVYNNAIQLATYAVPGARALATGTLTANTTKSMVSLEHAATSTKTVKIRRIIIGGYCTTAVIGSLQVYFGRGIAASTAGTAQTPGPRIASDPAAECVVKTVPTIVAATLVDTVPLTALAAATAAPIQPTVVYDWQECGEGKPWTLRAGVLESFVINVVSNAAQAWTLDFHIIFTEE